VQARIDPASWPRPAIFDWLAREGGIDEDEMLRVFNCGIGMVMVVPSEQAEDVLDRVRGTGERAYRIGEIAARAPDDPALRLGPFSKD